MPKCGKILLVAGLTLAWVLCSALPARATQWQQVAESAEGNIRQYVDTDSIQRSGRFVTIASYMEVFQATGTEVEKYTTEYDCERDRFRDLQLHWQPRKPDWRAIEADPLNEAARQFACSR